MNVSSRIWAAYTLVIFLDIAMSIFWSLTVWPHMAHALWLSESVKQTYQGVFSGLVVGLVAYYGGITGHRNSSEFIRRIEYGAATGLVLALVIGSLEYLHSLLSRSIAGGLLYSVVVVVSVVTIFAPIMAGIRMISPWQAIAGSIRLSFSKAGLKLLGIAFACMEVFLVLILKVVNHAFSSSVVHLVNACSGGIFGGIVLLVWTRVIFSYNSIPKQEEA